MVVNALIEHYKRMLEQKIIDNVSAAINVEFKRVIAERVRQILMEWTVSIEDKTYNLNEYLQHLLGRAKMPPGGPHFSYFDQSKSYIGNVMDKVLREHTETHLRDVLEPFAHDLKKRLRRRLGELLVTDVVRL